MKTAIFPANWFFCLACLWSAACCSAEPAPQQLLDWQLLGTGSVEVDSQQAAVRLTEGPGSKGVVLMSPSTYGRRVVVSFQVKPLVHEAICVVFLSASPVAGEEIDPGNDYDGNFNYWRGREASVRSYTAAFHTGYHQPNAFLIINPGPLELDKQTDTATEQQWYDVEYGRDEAKVWLKVNGELLLQGKDPDGDGLPPGRIGFRVRGPGDGSSAVLYRNVSIQEIP